MINNMASINLQVGKSYPIDYVIKELEKAPEVQLGHIVVMHEHLYHVNKLKLEEEAKKVKRIIAEGGKEYEKRGKKFVPTSDVMILSIIDPLSKYEKYIKFYKALDPEIMKGIEESRRESVAAPTESIIEEAKKVGIDIKKEEEFLDGLGIYFKRIGINTSPISGGKYVLFEKTGPLILRKVVQSTQVEYEKYKQYTPFYEEFFKNVDEGISASKKGEVAAAIEAIVSEVKELGIEGVEKDILRGMFIYFDTRGIRTEVVDKKFVVFKKVW